MLALQQSIRFGIDTGQRRGSARQWNEHQVTELYVIIKLTKTSF